MKNQKERAQAAMDKLREHESSYELAKQGNGLQQLLASQQKTFEISTPCDVFSTQHA
jgi:hypothetical protein